MNGSTRKAPHLFATSTLGVWARLIREQGGVPPRYWGRLAGILATSVATAPLRAAERLRYGRLVARTAIDHAPVFIQGFARSGTTHLHNLMGHDPDLGYVSTLQAIASPFFLTSRGRLERIIAKRLPSRRPVDNVALALGLPQEEEVALAALTSLSSAHLLTFPGRARAMTERLGSMRLSKADMADWERKYLEVLRKATLAFEGRRLVLKTPANLGRTSVLLRLFPEAKFVFIVRDPYDVFASNMKLYRTMLPLHQLQEVDWDELRNWVLHNYVDLTRRYLRDREAIPKGNLIEVRFEDIEVDPMGVLARIYSTLSLPGWDRARRPIAEYLGTLSGYRKNRHRIDRSIIDLVNRNWGFAVEKWGYEPPGLADGPEVPAGRSGMSDYHSGSGDDLPTDTSDSRPSRKGVGTTVDSDCSAS